ncbi:BnaC04g53670D [Brassica napus]|uniref:BnaC04g53670D protein n=1 Tax=Brassica napus TaxID=3708 RepID=A0A078JF62_BRANA|nr:BnaC04g53670D [Brassica napus]
MKELMYACLNGNLGDLAMDDSMAGHEILGFIDDYLKKLYHHRNVTLNNPHAS